MDNALFTKIDEVIPTQFEAIEDLFRKEIKHPFDFIKIPALENRNIQELKNELSSFEVSASRLNQNGSVLTINKNHKLFFDFKKQKQLNDEKTIKAYNNFDFRTLIEEDIKAKNLCNKYSKELKVTLLRVVPLAFSKNKFKLQYTISFPVELKGFYQDIIKDNPDFMSAKDNSKYKIIKDFFKKKSKNSNILSSKCSLIGSCFSFNINNGINVLMLQSLYCKIGDTSNRFFWSKISISL